MTALSQSRNAEQLPRLFTAMVTVTRSLSWEAKSAGATPMPSIALTERLLPWLFLIVGAGMAYAYPGLNAAPGETGQAALAVLHRGIIGDPYLLPTGPTAHVSPLMAWGIAAVFEAFGDNTTRARVALGVIAAVLYALSVRASLLLCKAVAPTGGASRIVCALFLLTPIFLFLSVVTFRQWDQPVAALILVLGWLVFERSRRQQPSLRPVLRLATLAGIGGLFSPAIVPALGIVVALMSWQRGAWRARLTSMLLASLVVAVFLVPWGARNQLELGRFILTRSNFGLELAAGNAPDAQGYSLSPEGLAMHPHDSEAAAEAVRTLGEVAFMDDRARVARSWIAADPVRFAGLTLTRIRMLFFPSLVMVGWQPVIGRVVPWVILLVLGALKLSAVGCAPLVGRFVVIFAFTLLPLASYSITHVNLRYEFMTYFTTVVAIAIVGDVLSRMFRSVSARAVSPLSPAP